MIVICKVVNKWQFVPQKKIFCFHGCPRAETLLRGDSQVGVEIKNIGGASVTTQNRLACPSAGP